MFHISKNIRALFATICVGTITSACSSLPEAEIGWNAQEQKVLKESFQHLNDYYVQDIDMAQLALIGMRAAVSADDAFNITFVDNELILTAHTEQIQKFTFENRDLKFPESWAKASDYIVNTAVRSSAILQKESSNSQITNYIRAMLGNLDRYSYYADPDEALTIQQSRDGFGGIGISLNKINGHIEATLVEENSPAATSGIRPGDILLEIDDILLEGLGVTEVQTLIRGPVNRKVKILFERMHPQRKTFSVSLLRSQITPNTVSYDANLLYPQIKIESFNKRTSKRLAEAIARAKDYSGGQLKGIILDIRGNPGGLLHEAIDSADLLLDQGILSQTEGRNPVSYQTFEAEPGNVLGNTPMVVLVDGGTASAAEILAAALQDHQRAVIVGSITYGKGTVQNLLSLSNHGELALTWANYLAPNHYHLQGYGILPNICTVQQENGIAAVLKPLRAHPDEAQQSFQEMREMQYTAASNSPEQLARFRNSCIWQGGSGSKQDTEVEAAKTLLSNPVLYEDALTIAYLSAGS